jgi:predicted XRE-type DNA-binding protein
MERPLDPDRSMWDWLLTDLLRYIKKADMSYAELARILNRDRSSVSNIAHGRRKLNDKDAKIIDELWDTGGHFARMLRWARIFTSDGWFGVFVTQEEDARVIKSYESLVIPGLLQLPEYAEALFTGDGARDVPDLLEERLSRQGIFERDRPPNLWAILSQNVIEWPVGGPDVLKRQLTHLLEVSGRTNVGIRVVPRSAGSFGGLDGSFAILSGESGEVAYTESPGGGRLVLSTAEVLEYNIRYDRIGLSALPEKDSLSLIRETMEAL